MRIAYNALLLDRGEASGVHRALRETCLALARTRPADASLVVHACRTMPAAGFPENNSGFNRVDAPRFVRWRGGRILWEQLRLPSRVIKDGCDLLHAPGYVIPRLCLAPTVATVHDAFALIQPKFCTAANRSHFRRMLPMTLSRASRIAVPTAAVRRDLLRWAGDANRPAASLATDQAAIRADRARRGWAIDPDRLERVTRVIPWGVSEFWRPAEAADKEAAARRLGLPPRFFLAAARPEPKKNLSLAVRAWFAAAAASRLPHRLVLAGPAGWGVELALARTIRELGADDRVLRLGYVDDVDLRALYSLADALLLPSLAEGFGLPALEAMACGCPVLASEIPALLEVAGRDHARFARPDDLPAWRVNLEALAADPGERRRLSEAGRRRARAFSWDACARSYWDLYREVLEEWRFGRFSPEVRRGAIGK